MISPVQRGPMTNSVVEPLSEKMLRGDVMAAACPSREILSHLTSRWGVLILIALLPGTLRFSEIRRRIGGVSERMLAQTLQLLEKDGMINRYDYNIVPLRVEYTLTPLGTEAAAKVRDLADWVENNLAALTLAHNSPDAVAR
ncbi:winged helix-turn-helix transcriptional regulator [Serratia plymuthica]|uniref:winged helix-turn-helix transcriptional regulator n=1 Tax=Serratia plymuthica TaxID=82996 RepID=UPI00141A3711|nr:helix-turn-helix domain-containing protein [Serratia plymuthica]NIC26916.1 helix-turn-helix transcriptional regulator [Serratia plymuthica]QPS88417.1 helix-turn-helix transcriptional regulator [Serratia plymuthica]